MLNFTTIQNPRTQTQFVTREVHEHKAPTDESIRLLREMEKEVASKTISVHRLSNNTLDAVWHVRQERFGMELIAHCKFILNGKEIEFEITLDRFKMGKDHAEKIFEEICKRITEELVVNLYTENGYESKLLGG